MDSKSLVYVSIRCNSIFRNPLQYLFVFCMYDKRTEVRHTNIDTQFVFVTVIITVT